MTGLVAVVVAVALGCASASDPPAPPTATTSAGRIDGGDEAGSADAGVPVDAASSACPADMVEIDGAFCKRLVQRCLERRKPWQCALFEEPSVCEGESVSMRFCIDRFEWPNRRGELPVVMSSWRDAKAACEGSGKRLCTDSEWTLACEGPDRLPFPYGYRRDAEACPIDKRSPRVDERRLHASQTRDAELARVDQREPSGARPRCVSAFGVHDLTGNVDEFVVNESGVPHKSALKGGNWGEFRNACRPATRKHDEAWRFYQTGFRCCRAPDP
jgi:formylglycine-generating enzyme required for sulfatase activity